MDRNIGNGTEPDGLFFDAKCGEVMADVKDLAYQDYLAGMKYKDIAEKHGVTLSTIKSWASRHWKKDTEKKLQPEGKKVATRKKKLQPEQNATGRPHPQESEKRLNELMIISVEQNEELTDKERLFCLCYMKNFNATQAARNAGYTENYPSEMGYQLLQKPTVRTEIQRLKAMKADSILVSRDDIVERYMRIAFSDMTDFVEFFQEEVPVIIAGKIVATKDAITGEPIPITKTVNAIRFKDSTMVDGGLICEISQGKDGSKIKLEDRQKALDWLAKYFLMNPMDQHKITYDNARLAIERQKADTGADGDQQIEITVNYGKMGGDDNADSS